MEDFEPLDLLACYGTDATARAITWLTASPLAPRRLRWGPSHVAVICQHHGSPLWLESTTLCEHPCAVLGYQVDGVQGHLPEMRIHDYVAAGGRVDLYRLSAVDRLSQAESELLFKILVWNRRGQGSRPARRTIRWKVVRRLAFSQPLGPRAPRRICSSTFPASAVSAHMARWPHSRGRRLG